jgi:hypothetical protein
MDGAVASGSKQYVIDTIMKMLKECGYDDFCFLGWFELGGFRAQEVEEQMQIFAEEVMPVMIAEPNDRLGRNIEIYYEAAEKAGFPDMHNRGRFKFGWDADKRREIRLPERFPACQARATSATINRMTPSAPWA